MALRQDEVFRYAGSYDIRPPSPSGPVILARSVARIAPSTIGSEYSRPVRLSTIERVSDGNGLPLVGSLNELELGTYPQSCVTGGAATPARRRRRASRRAAHGAHHAAIVRSRRSWNTRPSLLIE